MVGHIAIGCLTVGILADFAYRAMVYRRRDVRGKDLCLALVGMPPKPMRKGRPES